MSMCARTDAPRLGVLYAMEREAAGVLSALDAAPLEPLGGMPCYALPGGHVLCVGGVGKVNAALGTQLLIRHFAVTGVHNAGCAGALTDLPVGALVAATHCVQHDVDTALAGDPPGFVSTVARVELPCAPLPRAVGAIPGVVATGDWFGRDPDRARWIRDTFGAAVCDMEAGAAAQVCLRYGLPCQVVKVVSDHLFSPDQGGEYRDNFSQAMAALDAAVAAILEG